ncbi:1-acyl-sn-glycerol-3-phosphate acyltransferase [Methylomonas sp. SURF-2]|uniref:1-acyl-sn-glycerol-3-phosphate acyltransferase n=1 Tax=Methylomonas subterranea TaxID=2952225 RepID=A0ABT1TLI7_9GAMM|nr:lysophospholipid acyltransferase family protein [Methylomonas sp. SURF-2]MCQ8106334.1 1-acyl-sn-glycerol-3-phosphate acyltransferase [Methylomonas sp. SURF-2]
MLRGLFYLLLVKPLVLFLIGLNVRGRQYLPSAGPAIVVANHNSHLDTLVLMSLFPQALLADAHPVAAADYFFRNRCLKWFALRIIGIVPIDRRPAAVGGDTLTPLLRALDHGKILLLFPEGSRGAPEQLGKFKSGIAHLLSKRPEVPVIPVFFSGLGKCLPKGEFVLVPFFVDVFIAPALAWNGSRPAFMAELAHAFALLRDEAQPLPFDGA